MLRVLLWRSGRGSEPVRDLARAPVTPGRDLVTAALLHPERTQAWGGGEWDLLVRQARNANLLARLATALVDRGLLDTVPAGARAHLQAALILPPRQELAVRLEQRELVRTLSSTGVPLLFLKGAAYLVAGLPAARGRLFSDVDILVPKEALPQVEAALMLNGWATTHHNDYDQRYYRRWMHELPPMRHISRGSVLDVHHTILPETSRATPDPAKLRARAVAIPGEDTWVLAPEDMVLHSATHLFYGEMENGLRDLFDLNDLLRHFSQRQGFWEALIERARELQLERPLFYALRYCSILLDTPVPEPERQPANGGPRRMLTPLMDALFLRALTPNHASAQDSWTPLARSLLYGRAHWLRMPPWLLAYHLTVKALRKREDATDAR